MDKVMVETLADIEAFEKVPIEERLPFLNTYDMIKHGAAINPDAPAISFFLSGTEFANPVKVTYREFLAQVTRTANLFHDLGVGPSDVISYLLPNLPQTHYVLWGGEAAGIVNPINPMLEPSTIKEICQAAGTKVLVALGEFQGYDIWKKVMTIHKDLPDLTAIIRIMGPGDAQSNILAYDEILDNYNSDSLDSGRVIDPKDIVSMYHTGGTTGTPKLAPHSHFNESVMAFMINSVSDLNTGETSMCGLPLFHVNGATVTGSATFARGGHVVILGHSGYRDRSIIENFYKIIDHYRAVTFSSVPTVLSVLLETPKRGEDISSLRFVGCGAAPLSVELFKRFEARSQIKILEGYGLTEGTCVSSVNPLHGEQKVGSIGLRLPYQDMKVFIVDDEGRFEREARINEIGSVCIKGPNVFNGYKEKAHNMGVWPKEGWFNTGDLGRQDTDGYFWLTGRKKELIIRGGHNIDPAVIEEPLYRLPGIQTAAAVGRPDPYAGEVPIAYVQLQDGTELTEEQILDNLKQEIGERAAIPKDVFIIDKIPLTAVGKIFKPGLRWDATKRVYERELEALAGEADSVIVEVSEDKVHGTIALIRIKASVGMDAGAIKNRVLEILAHYTVHYEVIVE
ncbi:acyl-CoA synthetase [Thermodesulfobacteriota bacterium]